MDTLLAPLTEKNSASASAYNVGALVYKFPFYKVQVVLIFLI